MTQVDVASTKILQGVEMCPQNFRLCFFSDCRKKRLLIYEKSLLNRLGILSAELLTGRSHENSRYSFSLLTIGSL